MRRPLVLLLSLLGAVPIAMASGWPQWGAGPAHENSSAAIGQPLDFTLDDVIYDPFAPAEQAAAGSDLLVHYQAPVVEGADVFMTFKTGAFTSRANWGSQIWNVKRLTRSGGHLAEVWTMASDWKPEPFALAAWEPVFHPALHGQTIYAPGLGGSLLRFRRSDGMDLGRIKPFGDTLDPQIFVSGPLTIDGDGNVFYNAIKLDMSTGTSAFDSDALGAWLVRVTAQGVSSTVPFSTLVADAPAGTDGCLGEFPGTQQPWPPSTDAVPPSAPCGSQRPGLNVAPAVAADGTIYTVSRAHHNDRYGYLIAVNADLTPKWHASLRDRFSDGCGVLIPADGSLTGCRIGANTGVDPATNAPGAGRVVEQASSSPTVAPDGSILYGAYTWYNFSAGHLMKFSSTGDYAGSYPFGWDVTPTIYRHDGTHSILLKENHYAPANPEEYRITQLDASLQPEWSFKATNTQSCTRQADGSLQCVSDHPDGFEWCVNAAAVDANGTVYANSEDGGLYAIAQGGTQVGHHFLQLALGAAYTPLAIGDDGLIYTQNFGHLFVVGAAPDPIFSDGFD